MLLAKASESKQVDMIVLTDGSRILGLGDLGVQGTGIPIGKLDMYVAAAGINPQRVCSTYLSLLCTVSYLGLRYPRLEGEEYLSIVDEFMEAIHARWPKAIVQFEDFQMKWAFERLQQYQKRFCTFNDDMQGTASVALAGLLGSVRGADPAAAPFAKATGEIEGLGLREGANLVEVVKRVKPHVLLGLSGVGGIFNEQAMRESDSPKPAIFAMSNPTMNVFASGSPFKNVDLGNGKVGHVNQANNMYLFPGIGMGALLSGARLISDGMSQAVSECLASYITDEAIQSAILYPPTRSI
ncbi:hypothetical protein LOK49_LG11G00728 [Camellia lanceoleosa]|uniref:Uncharacterized protein n=1 Tax=Camellia lanceoleosa TaxID=1840588 RepID=A0ACC0FYN2_9ERIC|nr:hypothetical protein LOK49_LG11G00728 [Camellia lanceoleosa]